tara:strand:- start:100 stop:468 length:369 start_codon:yes stop_codon:yes gene_type:complete
MSCQSKNNKQMDLKNEKLKNYSFLKEMYEDQYFPNNLVDKGKNILVNLCTIIERENPKTLQELYILTHRATDEFNDLQNEFYENESEIETVARESIALDFEFIAKSYGFNADTEELIATRDW